MILLLANAIARSSRGTWYFCPKPPPTSHGRTLMWLAGMPSMREHTRRSSCGFCVEACPKDAITHGYNFELSVFNRADLLKTKDDLLITKQKQSKNYRVALSSEDVDSEYKEV